MQTNNLYNHANYRSGPTISNPKARKRATRILQKGARRPSNAQGLFAVTPRPHLPGRFRGLFWDGSLTSLSTRRPLGNGSLPVLRCLQVLRCRRLGNAPPPRMMERRPSKCFIDSRCCAAARCCGRLGLPNGTASRCSTTLWNVTRHLQDGHTAQYRPRNRGHRCLSGRCCHDCRRWSPD